MQFVRVASKSDFAQKRWKRVTLLGRKLAVFREPDGTFYAIEVACKHQNWDLMTGKLDGDLITCPRHGWVYNIKTGECVSHNAAPLRKYLVKVEGEDIWVSLLPDDSKTESTPD